MRADTGPAAPVGRYSCQGLVEPAEPPRMASRLTSCASRSAWGLVARSSFDEAYATPRLPAFVHGPKNELAANCAPAMVETALMSAEAKLSTEKLPPGSRGVVATSRMLAQS